MALLILSLVDGFTASGTGPGTGLRLGLASRMASPKVSEGAVEYASSCFLSPEWTALKLLSKHEYNLDSTLYSFELPRCTSLNLPACGCILALAPGAERDGSDAIRPYTPISDNAMLGKFELLVKRYEGGAMSQYLHNLPVGESVSFKHIIFNVKKQYPFYNDAGEAGVPAKTISLLCAGTGIAPIYQALLRLMNTPGDERKVTLLYGNKSPADILLKDELAAWVRAYPTRLKVVHVVGEAPDQPLPDGFTSTDEYTAEAGWIDEAKIKEHCFPPADDTLVFVCGLPVMYDAWCGPRTEAELKEGTLLHKLGYTTDMVAKM